MKSLKLTNTVFEREPKVRCEGSCKGSCSCPKGHCKCKLNVSNKSEGELPPANSKEFIK